jgi:iron complex outermembrane receptor protein
MRGWPAACLLAAGVACAQSPPDTKAPARPEPRAEAKLDTKAEAKPEPKPADPPQRVLIEGRAISPDDERRNSTLAMTVVGREELDAYGDSSILDVLQRLPGITLDGDAPRLRGMGGGYTLILLNGEPAPPGFSLDSLAPGEIERIEVIKGPTAEFGGVAGTINVILRGAPKTRQGEWRANAGYRALGPQGGTSFSWGDRVGAVGVYLPISASNWANAAGFDTQRVSRSSSGERIEQQVQGRDRWRGGGITLAPRLDWKVDDTRTLNWQAFLQRNESDNRSERSTEALAGPPPSSVQDRSASRGIWQLARTQAQWVQKQADGTRWELKGSVQGSQSRSASTAQGVDTAGINRPQRDGLSSQRETVATIGTRWRQPWGDTHTLVAGADLDGKDRRELRRSFDDGVEQIAGTVGLPFLAHARRVVAFVQDEWAPVPAWSWMGGLRAERVDLRTAGPGGVVGSSFVILSPVAHMRHALDEKGRSLLRASVARSIRVPDIGLLMPRYSLNGTYDRDTPNTPLAADTAGNPRLQPEQATGFDLAWEQHLAGGGVLSVGVFHRHIDRLIRRRIGLESVAEANVPRWVSRPVNLGSARSSGLELELKGRADELLRPLWAGAPKGLQLRAALSVYRSAVEQIDDPDARLDGQAPWNASMGFDQLLPGTPLSFGGNLNVTPGFSTQQTDRQRVWRGSVHRLDAYVQWRFSRQLQLRLSGNNLLAADTLATSRIDDLDGFTAHSATRRLTVTQFNASLTARF